MNHIEMIKDFFAQLNFLYASKITFEDFFSYRIEKMNFRNIEFSKSCRIFIRNYLPYTIERVKEDKYVFLNRDYKILSGGDDAPVSYVLKNLAFNYKDDIDGIYFYSDANKPQSKKAYYIDYLIRLKKFIVDFENNNINTTNKYFYRCSDIMKGVLNA